MASSRKSNLTDTVAARLAPLLPGHSHILIGLSGGMDSVVLLHLLHTLAPRFEWKLSALHVHHGISPNAEAWTDFCSGLCAQHGIPLHIERVDISGLRDEHGIEAAARKLRHAAFAKLPCDVVALAHHADDQAETLLLQLLRGAGVKGVAAMPVLSGVEGPVLSAVEGPVLSTVEGPVLKSATPHAHATLRPLLDIPRCQLLEYAQQHALLWVEDESNADDRYPRNFLRHRLLPLLEQRFPAYRDTLTRSARHFAEAGELLDELAQQDAQGAEGTATLELSLLRQLSYTRAKNLLRYWLHKMGAPMPQNVQLDELLNQLLDARDAAAVCVDFGKWQVRRFQDEAHVMQILGEFDQNLVLSWHGEAVLEWPALSSRLIFRQTQGQGISLARLQSAPVTLRLRSGGEALRPHATASTRSLKNLLQEHHVPPWQRERLPLLYCGNELVSVVGVAVAAGFKASNSEPGLVVESAS
jgi:tRNA(Ile)-lysidine synthase